MINKKGKTHLKFIMRTMALGMAIGIMFIENGISVQAAPKKMEDGTIFDAEYYAGKYPDVAAVYGTDEKALYQHYVDYGKAENREAVAASSQDIFDAAFYAAAYPDVVAVCGTDANKLYQHYLQYGKNEGRIPSALAMAGSVSAAETSVSTVTPATVETPATVPANETVAKPAETQAQAAETASANVANSGTTKKYSDAEIPEWIKNPAFNTIERIPGYRMASPEQQAIWKEMWNQYWH